MRPGAPRTLLTLPSPPGFRGRGRGPIADSDGEGEAGSELGTPHLTPTLSALRGGEAELHAACPGGLRQLSNVQEHGFGFRARAALQPEIDSPVIRSLGSGDQGGAALRILDRRQ